jgi:mRNA-degrading endonuclease RelE of RelBE toxin-antitoxin system
MKTTKIEVIIEEQPLAFIRRQSPDARKRLRAAIHAIERGDSFPDPLDDELEGFYKLRVENCRLILKHESGDKAPLFKVVFAERRSVVYEMFRQIIALE